MSICSTFALTVTLGWSICRVLTHDEQLVFAVPISALPVAHDPRLRCRCQ